MRSSAGPSCGEANHETCGRSIAPAQEDRDGRECRDGGEPVWRTRTSWSRSPNSFPWPFSTLSDARAEPVRGRSPLDVRYDRDLQLGSPPRSRRVVAPGVFRRRVAARIQTARLRLGITQEEAAERAGLVPRFYADIERSLRNPSLETMYVVARALRVAVADLVDIGMGPRVDLDHVVVVRLRPGPKPKPRRRQ